MTVFIRLAGLVLAAALLAPAAAAAGDSGPAYGIPRAMPSDYAADGVGYGMPRAMPWHYAEAGATLSPPSEPTAQYGMPRELLRGFPQIVDSESKPTGQGWFAWGSLGLGIGLGLVLAAIALVARARVPLLRRAPRPSAAH